MSERARLARRWLAVVPMAAVLAALGGAAAQAGRGAPAGALTLTGRAPTAYVSVVGGFSRAGHTVVPISTATNTAGKPINVVAPGAIAITPDGKTVYVVTGGNSQFSDGTVTPIATATNTAGKPIRVGVFPDELAVTPDGKTVYVTNLISDTVSPIATATNTSGKQIQVGVRPQALAVTPDGKTVYVANQGSPSTVTPIATATNRPGRPIRVGNSPLAIAVTPDGTTAYVANSGFFGISHTVTPIATATNRPGRAIRVGRGPFAIAITPDGKTAYVVNAGADSVTPIATATNTPGKPIKVGRAPVAIAITPDGKTAYVVNDLADSVTPINLATNTAGTPIPTGGRNPGEIAITPDGKTVYVSNVSSDTVTPIATATNTAGTPIKVGKGPFEIAITPAARAGTTAASALTALDNPLRAALARTPARANGAALAVPGVASAVPGVASAVPGVASAVPGGAAAAVPGSAALPGGTAPAARGVAASNILLLNGDRLVARRSAAGPQVLGVLPGAGSRLAGTVVGLDLGGVLYDIPQAALPYLGRGLNPDLFRLTSLAAHEAGGRLPVTLSYRGRAPALPGVTITRASGGAAEGYLTASGARRFGTALARQFLADHARGSYGQDGMFAGGVWMGLAGAPARAAARTPSTHSPMHTLTITGTNMAGRPDTGDPVLVLNADNSHVFTDPIESQNIFRNGTTRFSVPAGHYWALGLFSNLFPGVHEAVLPQINVSGTTTAHMDGRTANDKMVMITPRPALQHFASLILRHPTPVGPAEAIQIFTAENPVPIYVTPTTRRPTTGTLQVFPFEQLGSEAPGTPYIYELAFRNTSGLIPRLRYVIKPASLAAVDARYFSSAKVFGNYFEEPVFTRQGVQVVNDLFAEAGLEIGLPAPRRLTEYLTAGPGELWTGFYFLVGVQGFLGGQSDVWRPLPAGARVTQNWNAYPLHQGYNADLVGAANPFPWVPSASRAGDTLTLDLTPFSDSVPGHTGVGGDPDTGGHYEIDENGKQIAAGVPGTHRGPNGEFKTQVALSPRPGTVRLALSVAENGPGVPQLSPASQTVWSWRTARMPGATLPPGWKCKPTFQSTNRSCAAQPMMTLEYQVAGLGLDGSAPPGRQVLRLTAGHLQLAKAAAVTTASVSVSFDGGKTWHPARVSGHAGHYTAVFTAPAGALVTLRSHAADAVGGSITETITGAYRAGS